MKPGIILVPTYQHLIFSPEWVNQQHGTDNLEFTAEIGDFPVNEIRHDNADSRPLLHELEVYRELQNLEFPELPNYPGSYRIAISLRVKDRDAGILGLRGYFAISVIYAPRFSIRFPCMCLLSTENIPSWVSSDVYEGDRHAENRAKEIAESVKRASLATFEKIRNDAAATIRQQNELIERFTF